jgi:hypothetical protein
MQCAQRKEKQRWRCREGCELEQDEVDKQPQEAEGQQGTNTHRTRPGRKGAKLTYGSPVLIVS